MAYRITWFFQNDITWFCVNSKLNMARQLTHMGIKVRLVAYYHPPKPSLPSQGFTTTVFRVPRLRFLHRIIYQAGALALAIWDVINGTDVVITDYDTSFTMLPLNLLSRTGIIKTKFIMDNRGMKADTFGWRRKLDDFYYNLAIRYVKHFFDGMTATSDLYLEDICKRHRIDRRSVRSWTAGVDTNKFDPSLVDSDELAKLREQYGLDEKFVVMYHGVLSPSRGLSNAIKAISFLKKEGTQDIVLVFVGDGDAGTELRRLVRHLALQDVVRFIKPVSHENVPIHVMLCDAGILPFPDIIWYNMSTPLKLMEYLAMGKKAILSDIKAHRMIMGSSACAYFAADDSVQELAEAIWRCYKARKESDGPCQMARKLVLDKYTWEVQAGKLKKYLDEVIGRRVMGNCSGEIY